MSKKRAVRSVTPSAKQLLSIMDEYAKATGKSEVNAYEVADWALLNSMYRPPASDPRQKLARELARVAREDHVIEDGKPVRVRHAYRVSLGEEQKTFWVKVEDASPPQMRMCAQQRRRGILKDCEQLERDVKHYNKNYNPGESIQLTFDFTEDMAEKDQPTEYTDTPPDDEPIDGGPVV